MPAALPRVAWRETLLAVAAQVVALTVGSFGYGYHRDELYFRMLPAAWGYLDQPPLTPFLARVTLLLADEPWALRLPATVAAALSVLLVVLITRRLGGGPGAQTLAAFGYAFGSLPLMLSHLLLTSTIDLPLLLLLVLALLRALDGHPRSWVLVGVVAGLTASNRLLVVAVGSALVVGLLVFGPRHPLRTPWPWVGAVVAAVCALPQITYQVTHGWPQLAMGRALSANNSDDVRAGLPVLLLLMLGPPLVVVWGVGIGWLLRSGQRERWGFLVFGFVLMVAFTYGSGAQPHYPVHLMTVMYAAGCVPVARWLGAHRRSWRVATVVLVGVNAVVSVTLALPVVPVDRVGDTAVAGISPLLPDQIGWPIYVRQVAAAYEESAAAGAPVAVIASNYGEAGAIDRYGGSLGLPPAHSAHNALFDLGGPTTGDALVVGGQVHRASGLFRSCVVVGRLDNQVGVDNEEQGEPIAICRGPLLPWPQIWRQLRHLD